MVLLFCASWLQLLSACQTVKVTTFQALRLTQFWRQSRRCVDYPWINDVTSFISWPLHLSRQDGCLWRHVHTYPGTRQTTLQRQLTCLCGTLFTCFPRSQWEKSNWMTSQSTCLQCCAAFVSQTSGGSATGLGNSWRKSAWPGDVMATQSMTWDHPGWLWRSSQTCANLSPSQNKQSCDVCLVWSLRSAQLSKHRQTSDVIAWGEVYNYYVKLVSLSVALCDLCCLAMNLVPIESAQLSLRCEHGQKFKCIRFLHQWVLISLRNNLWKCDGHLTFHWWEIGCQNAYLKRAALHFCESFLVTDKLYLSRDHQGNF